MRSVWLVLILCGLPLIAAEKNRDWKTGQIVEADQTTRSLHTIAATDRNYLVKGTIGNGTQELTIGSPVRFAVEGKTMFISLDGREYRLYVMGERVAALKDPGSPAASAVAKDPGLPPSSAAAVPVKPAPEPTKPVAAAGESLDNDAVVKMILGGLKEDTVVRVIETRPGKYTLTADALAGLRAAGVPPSVIAAMSAKMTPKR